MKFSDALAAVLLKGGVGRYFAVTGGAAVHLIDSLHQVGLPGNFAHHEQGAALAADAYSRINGIGLCVTTTGPGVTNALTGTLCSWQDSVATVYLSGQSRSGNLASGFRVRQAGTQHLDVGPLVSSIVKEFFRVDDPRGSLERIARMILHAQEGRPGPVWIDVPLDIQLTEIDENELEAGLKALDNPPAASSVQQSTASPTDFSNDVFDAACASDRPLFLFGNGLSRASIEELGDLLTNTKIPFVTTWGLAGHPIELLDGWVGRIGVSGMRGANKAAMASDLLISIGARFGQSTSGTNLGDFAPNARIFLCDIDAEEVRYALSRREMDAIVCYSEHALSALNKRFSEYVPPVSSVWLGTCEARSRENFLEYESARHSDLHVELYRFIIELNMVFAAKKPQHFNLSIDGGGTVVYASMQAFRPIENVTQVLAAGPAPMGTGIPHAIGLATLNSNLTVVLVGDGSFMFNIQEIQTAKSAGLDMLIFVLQNHGYTSIRSTQAQFLESRFLGSSADGGLEVVDLEQIARGFGIEFHRLNPSRAISEMEKLMSQRAGVVLIEVPVSPSQEIYPRVAFQKDSESGIQRALPLDQMFPLGS